MIPLRELDLRHLVALEAVVDEGTFARAAEHLGYTQSAVSQQIAGLERIVGGRVFETAGDELGDMVVREYLKRS